MRRGAIGGRTAQRRAVYTTQHNTTQRGGVGVGEGSAQAIGKCIAALLDVDVGAVMAARVCATLCTRVQPATIAPRPAVAPCMKRRLPTHAATADTCRKNAKRQRATPHSDSLIVQRPP